ncbi:SusC/RagA family TonB-linked outer membrane protein [Chitinophaga sp. SYP-B3965]|nr:SusC/RagA family TonB-linked outer membrane protein [Chitinophaga sp. SYP-B3965]
MQKTANRSRWAVPDTFVDQPPKFRLSAQMLRIMRLTSFFLLTICLHISAKSSSQTVTLSGKDVPLEKVFSAIKKQTGYVVFYNRGLLNNSTPVTLTVNNMPLTDFMTVALKDQPLDFIINGKTITLSERRSLVIPVPQAPLVGPALVPVSGIIRNSSGVPLEGVSIRVNGSKTGTRTNAQGHFVINANEGDVLTISYVGFLGMTVRINATGAMMISTEKQDKDANIPGPSVSVITNNSLRNLSIQLAPSATSLQTVTVNKGYYTTSQKLNTGNTVTIRGEEIEKQPVANFLQALQGRVAGLIITQQSGVPGSNFTVQIRGQNSILNGNTPLYIVDGIPYSSDKLNQVLSGFVGATPSVDPGSAAGLGGLSPLNNINPADLESIEILKDADATAIYGSRGANGVILITTKRGGAGPLTVSANFNYGTNAPTRLIRYMNTQEYLEMRNEAFKNDNVTPTVNDYDVNGTWSKTKYTDWTKQLVGGQSSNINGQVTLSGGSEQTQFQLGMDYSRQNPPYGGGFADNRGTVRFNISNTSKDRRFRMGFSTAYSVDYNNLPGMDVYANIGVAPNAPDLLSPDGSLLWTNNVLNPFASLLRQYNATTKNLMTNVQLTYHIIEGLNVKASLGYTNSIFNESRLNPASSFFPLPFYKTKANASFGTNGGDTWIFEPQAEYDKDILGGNLRLLVGSTMQGSVTEGQVITGNFRSDASLNNMNAATEKNVANSYGKYNYAAVFGRISYNFDEKYVINLTGRRDGSSRFGPGRQFANFGAIGAGWIFSDEKFIKDHLRFLSFGKFRGSYGITGSDQVGGYLYLDSYTPTPAFQYQGLNGLTPSRIFNEDFGWENNKKLEGAVELGFLKDRLNVSASWFKNRSSNQLVQQPLSPGTGADFVQANLPATVQNTGWEFVVSSTNIKNKGLTWRTNMNVTISRNKLVAFPGLAQSSYASRFVVGEPVTMLRLFQFADVDPATGVYRFVNKSGQLTTSPAYGVDNIIIFHPNPDFYGGVQNSLTYKGISLDVFFQFTKQRGKNMLTGLNNSIGSMNNVPALFTERWQKPGDIARIQKYTTLQYGPASNSQTAANNSDFGWTDASYVRCKNVAISYNVQSKWIKKTFMKSARVYLQAQNLFTITNYMGADPETQGLILPPMKTINGGFQFSL